MLWDKVTGINYIPENRTVQSSLIMKKSATFILCIMYQFFFSFYFFTYLFTL